MKKGYCSFFALLVLMLFAPAKPLFAEEAAAEDTEQAPDEGDAPTDDDAPVDAEAQGDEAPHDH